MRSLRLLPSFSLRRPICPTRSGRSTTTYITAPDKAGEGTRVLGALREPALNLLAVHRSEARVGRRSTSFRRDSAAFVKRRESGRLSRSQSRSVFLVEGDDRAGADASLLNRLGSAGRQRHRRRARCAPDPAATGRCYGLSSGREEGIGSPRGYVRQYRVSERDPLGGCCVMASRTERFKKAA